MAQTVLSNEDKQELLSTLDELEQQIGDQDEEQIPGSVASRKSLVDQIRTSVTSSDTDA